MSVIICEQYCFICIMGCVIVLILFHFPDIHCFLCWRLFLKNVNWQRALHESRELRAEMYAPLSLSMKISEFSPIRSADGSEILCLICLAVFASGSRVLWGKSGWDGHFRQNSRKPSCPSYPPHSSYKMDTWEGHTFLYITGICSSREGVFTVG